MCITGREHIRIFHNIHDLYCVYAKGKGFCFSLYQR
jgi:hypothetical protein